jgi:hypothetical protein
MPRSPLKSYKHKSIREMTYKELDQCNQSNGGLPVPNHGASSEEWNQWYVANCFLIWNTGEIEKEIANREAANDILECSEYKKYLPYLEQALGRNLTDEEIASRCIH